MDYKTSYIVKFLLFFLIISCNTETQKEIEFKNFSIKISNSWKKIQLKTIDSEDYAILTDKNDTIHVDSGKDNFPLYEIPVIMNENEKNYIDNLNLKSEEIIFSKKPSLERDLEIHLNEFYKTIIIDNKKGMMRIPKNKSKGILGIVFNNINDKNEGITIYSKNLMTQDELVNSFKTIKFKNK